jgi:hypothetical protein
MRWDLFICHASEDKTAFVEPLARALRDANFRVWYDSFELKPGDSIRRAIDEGLRESSAGVVVLSPRFFSKEWPQRELDALIGQQTGDAKRLVPIWLDLGRAEISRRSPLLIDQMAIRAELGLDAVLAQLQTVIEATGSVSTRTLDEAVSAFVESTDDSLRLLEARTITNFRRLLTYANAYGDELNRLVDVNEAMEDDELADQSQAEMAAWQVRAMRRFEIPDRVYLSMYEEVDPRDSTDLESRLKRWSTGCLTSEASAELLYDLDDWLDFDWLYVFFGLPNFSVAPAQREQLQDAVIRIGSRRRSAVAVSYSAWLLNRRDDNGDE